MQKSITRPASPCRTTREERLGTAEALPVKCVDAKQLGPPRETIDASSVRGQRSFEQAKPSRLTARLTIVPVHLPPQIPDGGFVHRSRYRREIRRNVMLEPVLANVVQ